MLEKMFETIEGFVKGIVCFSTLLISEPAKTSLFKNSVVSIKQSPKPIKLKSVIRSFKNCISRLRYFIKPKRFAGTTHA